MGLIDRGVRVSVPVGIGVRNLDSPEGLASDHTRTLGDRPVQRLEQIVVFVGIAVRPAIDRDGLDVARWIETSGRQGASELIAYMAFERLEFRAQQFASSCAVLILVIQARTARRPQ